MSIKTYDYTIIGAGIYGLYIAHRLSAKYPNKKIVVVECDDAPFKRASYINQARVHNGYHYPRSLSTALKSSGYYERFIKDYHFAINKKFQKIYALSSQFSYTSGDDFQKFCKHANIPCEPVHYKKHFKKDTVGECFLTEECSLDSKKICEYFISALSERHNVSIMYNTTIQEVHQENDSYKIKIEKNAQLLTYFVINTTYASTNQILNIFHYKKMEIKYEIAEICLCTVTKNIRNTGLTIMDGPFFSLMPFGLSGYHSLSAVNYTPHKICSNELPTFDCQKKNLNCTPVQLDNCNTCFAQPKTAWKDMVQLTKKYLHDNIEMHYHKSLFAIKPILKSSEITDSRPTLIEEHATNPTFISIFSGKLNTMYDLDDVLTW